jgi:hypothetical protein
MADTSTRFATLVQTRARAEVTSTISEVDHLVPVTLGFPLVNDSSLAQVGRTVFAHYWMLVSWGDMQLTLGIKPSFVCADLVDQVAELVLSQELVDEDLIGI